eukprot:m.936424 g.936424  ORF g.936424 m.936424 type:complete len:81 (+) comp23809_c1_seq15:648-890(+)
MSQRFEWVFLRTCSYHCNRPCNINAFDWLLAAGLDYFFLSDPGQRCCCACCVTSARTRCNGQLFCGMSFGWCSGSIGTIS